MDVLHYRVRELGFLNGSGFAASIARMPQRALAALIEELIPPTERQSVSARLRRQGTEGDDLQSLVLGLIKTAGRAAAGTASEHLGATIAEIIGSVFARGAPVRSELSSG